MGQAHEMVTSNMNHHLSIFHSFNIKEILMGFEFILGETLR